MKIFILLLSLFIFLPVSLASAPENLPDIAYYKIIDNFNNYKVGEFPNKWRTWPFQKDKVKQVYKVKQEDNFKFMQAYDDKNYSVQALRKFYWPIDQYPYLTWKWRATLLPKGAKESNDATNDSACGVYVIIGQFSGHALKYAWSTTLPKGEVVTRRDDKLKIVIKETGAKTINQWQQVSVNVLDDYKKYFGQDLAKNPSGIAILTDGNAVQKPAGCDYADFVISKTGH
ncbi:MAG: DUF3047 domain-containing protein [Pseudomonadota bacterium]